MTATSAYMNAAALFEKLEPYLKQDDTRKINRWVPKQNIKILNGELALRLVIVRPDVFIFYFGDDGTVYKKEDKVEFMNSILVYDVKLLEYIC